MHKNKIFKKATAGVLSFLMAAQVMIFGDGTAQGILHADTLAEAAESIEKLNEKQQLAEEFKEKVSRLGEINLNYSSWSNKNLSNHIITYFKKFFRFHLKSEARV